MRAIITSLVAVAVCFGITAPVRAADHGGPRFARSAHVVQTHASCRSPRVFGYGYGFRGVPRGWQRGPHSWRYKRHAYGRRHQVHRGHRGYGEHRRYERRGPH